MSRTTRARVLRPSSPRCAAAAGLLLASATGQGCGDDGAGPADVPSVLASAPADRDTLTAQEVLLEPRDRRTIVIAGNLGDGCEAKLVPAVAAEKRGLLQIYFDAYRLRLPAGGAAREGVKHCSLSLRVSGAAGFRYAIASILYVGGYAMLTPGAEARFVSTVSWSGREPLGEASTPMSLTVPTDPDASWVPSAQWVYNQEFVLQDDRLSHCLASESDSDEVTLDTSLMLDNHDGRYDAELDLVSLSGQASVVPSSAAAIVIELEPHPCP